MIKYIYATRNIHTGLYSDPHVVPEDKDHILNIFDGLARSGRITEFMASQEHYFLGTFDDKKCVIDLLDKPEFFLSGAEYYIISERARKQFEVSKDGTEKKD